ncbi:MAG: hypothetical protein HY040_23545 [Planctomycetes bacterium]|nr:hypothetical protein [Planctomycetota bacterium]
MHQEAADRIELSREKLLNTKLRLLDILIDPAMKRDSGKVWPNFVKLLAASFTPGDIEFFFYMDRFYLGTDARYGSDVNPDPKMVPGGLTNWIDVLGHFEKEIRFGTLARTKAAMLPALFQKLTTASEGGHEYRWAYLNVVGSAEQARLDAILRQLFLRLDEEKKFWPEFRHRVNSSLSCEFLVPVTVYVPFAIVDGISSFLQQRADQMFEHWPAPAAPAVTSQQVKRIAAKFPAPEGLKWSEVTIEFVSNDSLRFTARGVQKRYTYTELGFKDGRKGDLPDTSWEFLKLMAEHNGDSSKATAASQVLKHKATKKVQAINKRLKELTGLSERPISWSRGDSKYRIAFNFHKNTLQKNLANSSKEEPEEREDPKED